MADSHFADVLAGNRAYAATFALAGLPGRAARGLAVVTCMDSRLDPLGMLDLRPGDAKVLRNPGGRVTPEALGALVIARALLAVERIMVIVHTGCRMAGASEAELRSGIEEATGEPATGLTVYPVEDQDSALRQDVTLARADPRLAGVEIGGFRYDVATGLLTELC